jgi:hypothetical protein
VPVGLGVQPPDSATRSGTCANRATLERQESSSGPRFVVTKSGLATNAIPFDDG